MSNKINQRRVNLYKKRENTFNLNQSIKDMVIPQYNALKDPFLDGYFTNPQVTKHLRSTGVIPKRRGFSLKLYRQVLTENDQPKTSQELKRHKKSKSETKSKDKNEKLPPLTKQALQSRDFKSEEMTRLKKYYTSKKHSRQL